MPIPASPEGDVRRFAKYHRGAYHWKNISRSLVQRHLFTVARYELILATLPSWRGLSIVDIGAGDGALSNLILEAQGEVTCVEPTEDGLNLAKSKLSGWGTRVKFARTSQELQGSFDVVVCAEVIEHVDDPHLLLLEIKRLIKPGGQAIITTPIRITEYPSDSEHVREYFPDEFKKLVARVLPVLKTVQAIPLERMAIYNWRPVFLFRRRLPRLWFNFTSVYFKRNFLLHPVRPKESATPMHQLILASRLKDPIEDPGLSAPGDCRHA
jgi:2-polyprenyl-3-methyl-5-hydroxy-6-metoxy-1,4-benzoquinol methylase